nr:MAG TPA: hypothetical protein [Caudoviricetes sp.]
MEATKCNKKKTKSYMPYDTSYRSPESYWARNSYVETISSNFGRSSAS